MRLNLSLALAWRSAHAAVLTHHLLPITSARGHALRLRLAPAAGLHVRVCGQDRERERQQVCVCVSMHMCVCLVAVPHFPHLLITDSP